MTPGPLPLSETVAARIRAFRTTRGLSAEKLAQELTAGGFKISRGVLANIENGRSRAVSVDLLHHVMAYFDVTYYDFFEGPLCNGCRDNPPQTYICRVCARTRGDDGGLIKC